MSIFFNLKKIFSFNRKQIYDHKLSNKSNLNINKNNNIKTSIIRDERSNISNEEIEPVNFNLYLKSDNFCREALDQLMNKNTLIKIFVKKMEDLDYSPGINGQIRGFLYDITQINDSSTIILNSLQSKCEAISHVFLVCAAAMATDQTVNINSVYGMIDPMIFSYENVISSHFQLLNAWYKVRLYDLSGAEYTILKWKFSELLNIHNIILGCNDQIDQMKIFEEKVQNELRENGLSNQQFLNTNIISPILKQIAALNGGNYFPGITQNPSQSGDCLYSSQSPVIPSSFNKVNFS